MMLRRLNSRLREGHIGHLTSHYLTTRSVVRLQPVTTAAGTKRHRPQRRNVSFIPKRTSPELRKLLGENREMMSEAEAIFLIQRYSDAHNQADPTDGNFLICDEQTSAVLGQDRVERRKLHKTLLFSHLESIEDNEHNTAWAIPRVAKLLGTEPASGEEAVKKLYTYVRERKLRDPKQRRYAISNDAMKAAGFGTKVDFHQWLELIRRWY